MEHIVTKQSMGQLEKTFKLVILSVMYKERGVTVTSSVKKGVIQPSFQSIWGWWRGCVRKQLKSSRYSRGK